MRIREATRADNSALCTLERRTPLEMGDDDLVIERTNFFATHDLQERTVVMVAEDDAGEVAGVCAGALNEAPLAAKQRLLLYIHHERIAPEHQRGGLGGELTRAVADYWKQAGAGHIDSSYWLISPGNRRSRNFAERSGNQPWPRSPYFCSLDATPGGSPSPKRVGAGPTFDIVRLLNRTHAGKDLFRPYEQVDFGQRLARSPAYGWGDVYGRSAGGPLVAVAAVWDRGAATATRRGQDGPPRREWVVADYGYEAGAEGEMAALLRELCAAAASAGRDAVSLALDPEGGLYAALRDLPHSLAENLFYAPRIEAPADLPSVYLDPFYW
jgi:GNAT superfamily N-acetyltransferase